MCLPSSFRLALSCFLFLLFAHVLHTSLPLSIPHQFCCCLPLQLIPIPAPHQLLSENVDSSSCLFSFISCS
ncbi:hypothetical protein CIPAW_02G055900 [Carya illinoinensis]|uniref:Secreted protein n=1 Tax=Carya illinoinensis TaxID=32201 RepID=A0A8T1RAM9_CARIL|nr:hypothetical protein CIPAW_02G055900 [Carya illinoinensis]